MWMNQAVLKHIITCTNDQYTCFDGECIQRSYQCVSWVDCNRGEDDMGCSGCESNDNACIYWDWVCDGEDDCGDGSDEHWCYNLCWSIYSLNSRRSITRSSADKVVPRSLDKGGKVEATGTNLHKKKNEAENKAYQLQKLRFFIRGKGWKIEMERYG